MAKALRLHDLRGRVVFVYGYNTTITTQSLLAGYPVYLCDDGFVRDTRGFFRSYKASRISVCAFFEILDLPGVARCARDVDHQLKVCGSIVASSDGNVIDAASNVIDLPGEISRRRGISPLLV